MAITTSFSLSINDGITISTFKDSSTYDSPIRANVGVFARGYKVDKDGVMTEKTLTPNTTNPETVESWTFPYTLDGHYKFKYVAVPDYDAAVTYAKHDAVYDSVTDAVYVSTQDSNTGNSVTNATYWTELAQPTDLVDRVGATNESLNVTAAEYNEVTYYTAQQVFGNKASSSALSITTLTPDDVELYELMSLYINAMNIANTRKRYSDGEKIARKAATIS